MKILFQIKDEHPELGITIEAALPCESQAIKWLAYQQREYYSMLVRADKIKIISPVYTESCMMDRNKYMVDNSSLLIAVSNGTPGGTMKTIECAKKRAINIVLLKF